MTPIQKITVGEIEEAIQDVRYRIIAGKLNELIDRVNALQDKEEIV